MSFDLEFLDKGINHRRIPPTRGIFFEGKSILEVLAQYDGALGHLEITDLDNNRKLKDFGSCFMICPGVFITAAHTVRDYVKSELGTDFEVHICLSIDRRRSRWFRAHQIFCQTDGDIALVSAELIQPSDDRTVTIQSVRVSPRIPFVGESVLCLGFRQDLDDREKRTVRALASPGRVVAVLPQGRDGVMLPQPCFLVEAGSLGGMSGGPVTDVLGNVIGTVSVGAGNDMTYATLIYTSFLSTITQIWPNQYQARKVLELPLNAYMPELFRVTGDNTYTIDGISEAFFDRLLRQTKIERRLPRIELNPGLQT